ncbi:MAG: FAD-binding protein [Nitrospirota bacterium]|nr:FAD-binding protein [Nitrospirota bacterium]
MDSLLEKYIGVIEATRDKRIAQAMPLMREADKEHLLTAHHPDYRKEAYRPIAFGPNQGEETVHELAALLEADSPLSVAPAGLAKPDFEVDVLILGGGGAGATAALMARELGASVMIATKLRLGDSNTVMAEGGVQVAVKEDDSPIQHFVDAMHGGHYKNDPRLLKVMVEDAPFSINWLDSLGVLFDRDADGNLKVKKGGGTSRARLLACKDYTGLDMMRVLKDTVLNTEGIQIMEFAPAIELLTNSNGQVTGAVLQNLDVDQRIVVRAKSVIMATGGIGRLHIQNFPTSNHFGATGDALPLCYRLGARLAFPGTFQYHPTGAIYPEQMAGLLVTEAIRSGGAHLINRNGERFVNELEARDVVCAAIIRECAEGRGVDTPFGRQGVWLDIPVIDAMNGEGVVKRRYPGMLRKYERHGIDIPTQPVLIYPTLHYQNGGVAIGTEGETEIAGLYVAGEAAGGIHGTNRLMGNSLLDIIVFGARAGRAAAQRATEVDFGELTLNHLDAFRKQMKKAGVEPTRTSPMLLPDYVRRPEEAVGSA